MYDLKIKNAKIVDGTGLKAFHGDIGVIDDLIVDRGKNLGIAKKTYNADGMVLCPGFIDLHTHYDAQLTWDPTASPSLHLGVTTALIGNCGSTIAPCKPGISVEYDILSSSSPYISISPLLSRSSNCFCKSF